MKIPLKSPLSGEIVLSCISKKYGSPSEEITQIDTYFQSPICDFWRTDEALRLRQTESESDVEKIEITYKGPKQGKSMKVRDEITIEASNGDKAITILQKLGFELFTNIKKRRINWIQNDVTISLDKVEDLGTYLEIEIITSKDSDEINKSKEKILHLTREIIPNWDGQEERKSYLELKIQKQLKYQGT